MLRGILLLAGCAFIAACSDSTAETSDTTTAPEQATTAPEAASAPAVAAKASFDCTKAASEAEKLVCSDAELAALDLETARLYNLAETGKFANPQRVSELKSYQRGWIKGRDECWKEDDKRACVASEYASRIAELRTGYADARSDDGAGISVGPLAAACDGLDYGISVTFINSDPGMVNLRWLDQDVTLAHAMSASGARYTGSSFDGSYEFWEKGDEAMFTGPDGKQVNCRIEEIG